MCKFALLVCSFFCLNLFGQDATKVISDHFDNLYQIDHKLYRSEQPDKKGMQYLSDEGIITVLNLRRNRSDENEGKKTKLKLSRVRINTWKMDYDDILASMKIIYNSKGPVVVHCWHGSDRTGCIVAIYRILSMGWTKAAALDELENGGFGFHAKYFDNIIDLIKNLDLVKLRSDLNLHPVDPIN